MPRELSTDSPTASTVPTAGVKGNSGYHAVKFLRKGVEPGRHGSLAGNPVMILGVSAKLIIFCLMLIIPVAFAGKHCCTSPLMAHEVDQG